MELMGRNLNALSCQGVSDPLLTIIVVDRSPQSRIDECLASIARQDHPCVKCVVVDACRSRRALSAIERLHTDDNAFRLCEVGDDATMSDIIPMIVNEIVGGFVSILDADDSIFPGFASHHLQVHLALPQSVSLTISPTVYVDAEGHTFDRSPSLDRPELATPVRLQPPEIIPRLSAVTAARYDELTGFSAFIPASRADWLNDCDHIPVFRSSMLRALVAHAEAMRDLGSQLALWRLLCHVMTGSAVIDTPLSARQSQDARLSMAKEEPEAKNNWPPGYWQTSVGRGVENQRLLLEEIDDFVWMLGERYWDALDGLTMMSSANQPDYYDSDVVAALFRNHAPVLRTEFGDDSFLKEIGSRFRRTKGLYVVMNAYDGSIPRQFLDHIQSNMSPRSER